ncbi:MAG: fluoride efflux transporter CrcB [Gammaproteobacteria bacterium]|nr:MAG: fluoride efflux transporter CrcB [Gammaproteobacteria bacterium]
MSISFSQILWVALGGALGAASRFALSSWVNQATSSSFPWGTYAVNILGSCVFGVLFVVIFSNQPHREELRLLVMVGFLGAFTTFSTFSFETVRLMESGLWPMALANILFSVITCILGAWVGMGIARLF